MHLFSLCLPTKIYDQTLKNRLKSNIRIKSWVCVSTARQTKKGKNEIKFKSVVLASLPYEIALGWTHWMKKKKKIKSINYLPREIVREKFFFEMEWGNKLRHNTTLNSSQMIFWWTLSMWLAKERNSSTSNRIILCC